MFAKIVNSLRRRVGERLRMVLAQTRKPRFVPDLTQPSLFKAGSIVRVIHLDAAMIIGGIRALLLQSLHPLAMTAMAEHSDYKNDPFGRLRRTVDFLGWTSYGTLAQAEKSIATVKRIHDTVVGTTAEGETYSANDPHLLMWIHVAEVDSFLVTHELFGRPRLSPRECDEYVANMGIIAERLGAVDPPSSVAEMREVIDRYRNELRLIPQGREAIRFLEDFPLSIGQKIAYRLLFSAAVRSLPRWAQEMIGREIKGVVYLAVLRQVSHVIVRVLDWGLKADLDLSRYPRT